MIASLEKVKAILGINKDDVSNDAQLSELLPIVQDYILTYCRNDFSNYAFITAQFTISDTITCEGGISEILNGYKNILIVGSEVNGGYYTVSELTDTEIEVEEELIEEEGTFSIAGVIYPKGLIMTFANMVGTRLGSFERGNIKSKKFETFSVTYATEDMVSGFMKSDILSLNKYRKL